MLSVFIYSIANLVEMGSENKYVRPIVCLLHTVIMTVYADDKVITCFKQFGGIIENLSNCNSSINRAELISK